MLDKVWCKFCFYLIFALLGCMCLTGFRCHVDDDDDHYVNEPDRPSGPSTGIVNTDLVFSTGGSRCSDGDIVEYRFDFGDGYLSGWSTSGSAIHRYTSTGTYRVYAQARCKWVGTYSYWSNYHQVQITTRDARDSASALRGLWDDGERVWVAGDRGALFSSDHEGMRNAHKFTDEDIYGVWGEGNAIYCCGSNGALFYHCGCGWQKCQISTGVTLYGISGAKSHVFAVGEKGTVVYGAYGNFSCEKIATEGTLYDVWVENESSAFAVGDAGAVFYFNGLAWMHIASPCTTALYSVCGTSYWDVWAVGEQGTVLHFDGARWEIVPSPTNSALKAIGGMNGFEFYVGGDKGALFKWEGGQWMDRSLANELSIEAICLSVREILIAGEEDTLLHIQQ